MKNLLLVLNPMYPRRDHNSNLLLKLVSYMNVEAKIITLDTSIEESSPPSEIDGIPAFFEKCYTVADIKLFALLMRIFGSERAREYFCEIKMRLGIRRVLDKKDIVFSTYFKKYPALAAQRVGKKTIKALYMMDPSDIMCQKDKDVNDEDKHIIKLLKGYDVIFTTHFIREAMIQKGHELYAKRIVEVSFPMITGYDEMSYKKNDDKISLLFAGTIYPDIRSPNYYLKIASQLDERFRIVFAGKYCKEYLALVSFQTNAELIALPNLPHEEVKELLETNDIMINIGNSVPVHIPSKIFEYINTGKPIINFYKFDECPTLYYTERYPLCLNLNENDKDINRATERFVNFCVENKGKRLEQQWIMENYAESTPAVIAKTIDDTLNELLEEKRRKKR